MINFIKNQREMSFKLAFIGVFNMLLGACGSNEEPSKLLQITPFFGEALNPLEYFEASDEEVYDNGFSAKYGDPGFLGLEDPNSQKAQAWADNLHEAFIRRYPKGQFDRLPKPVVRIMKHQSENAFASSAQVCLKIPVIFENVQQGDIAVDHLLLVNTKGEFGVYEKKRLACVNRMNHQIQSTDVLRHFSEKFVLSADCKISTRGDAIVIGSGCKVPLNLGDRKVKELSGIVLTLQTNRITLSTGLTDLFKSKPDLLLVTVLHELAHYYRAHGTLFKKRYSFFYRISDPNFSRDIPNADPALSELGERLRSMPKYRTQPIKGQTFHSEMYSYLASVVNLLVSPHLAKLGDEKRENCSELINFVKKDSVKLGRFPQQTLENEALELYFSYEKQLKECFTSLEIAEKPLAQDSDVLPYAEVKKYLWAMELKETSATLFDAWQSMNAKMWTKEAKESELLKAALDERVGYYTTEEEADNLSLDWLFTMDKDPKLAIQHWLKFSEAKKGKEQDGPFNFAFERCQSLLSAPQKWHENGVRISVPLGSYAEYHHSTCFRIYHLSERLRVRHGME